MNNSTNGGNGSEHTPAGYDRVRDFDSLKQSLSRTPNRSHDHLPPQAEDTSAPTDEARRSSKSNRSSPPLFVDIPKLADPADIAFAALQYLPTPLLVLSSSSKCIVLANEAMGRLLGLTQSGALQKVHGVGKVQELSVTDVLRGQTLAQIGVDMLQDGELVWADWEKCLDRLADEIDKATTEDGAEGDGSTASHNGTLSAPATAPNQHTDGLQPGVNEKTAPKLATKPPVVHDAVVNVVLSAQPIRSDTGSSDVKQRPVSLENQVQANMIISIWNLDKQKYFTLTFTSATTAGPPSTTEPSRTVSRAPNGLSLSPRSDTSQPSSNGSGTRSTSSGRSPSATVTSPTSIPLSLAPFPLAGPPSRSNLASTPSFLQKVTRLKDAMLNVIEIPIFAMWKDMSLAFPNKAGARLSEEHAGVASGNSFEPVPSFKVYTEDFERELGPEEYPLIVLCKTQKPFSNWKVGLKSLKTERRRIFEVSGEGIYDEQTGEFMGGMVALKDVTEYTDKLAAQHEESEQQFQLICDTMPQLLWTTTPEGMHDWFSKRWYDFTGLTAKESIGTGWQLPFHLDDIPASKEKWLHSLATGDEYSTEYRCRRHDGEWRWMLGRALPLRDHKTGAIVKWFGTCTDIHEQIEARQAAKQTREKLLKVIAHAKVTVWSVDSKRNLTFIEGPLMWDQDEKDIEPTVLHQNVYEVFGRKEGALDLPLYKEPIEKIFNGEAKEQITEHHIDGNGRWFRTRFVPVLAKRAGNGQETEPFVDEVIGVSMDVTEAKETEANLQSQEEENIRLLSNEAAANEASRLKSQFLSNMSHEIRTPIAGVIGMSELLADTKLDAEQREVTENIQRSANALLSVINDVLDLSKVESGRLDIEEVQFNLSVVVKDVSKMLSFAAERKNLEFKSDIRIQIDQDLVLMGDPGRVRQVLTNLLTNSIKFTSEGYVKLAVIAQKETSETIEVRFVVEDTGIGIEDDVQERLFKPFSQADSSTARRFGGTGLGLTICKNLVELMQGEISLQSTLGHGTTAVFWIPFNKPQYRNGSSPLIDIDSIPDRLQSEMSVSGCNSEQDLASSTPPPTPQDTTAAASARQGRSSSLGAQPPSSGVALDGGMDLPFAERKAFHVLVVEDNEINQQIALKTIKKLNFSVNAVWNGQEALDYLLKEVSPSHPKPDVILMDVQMPILDGYRATHIIRHNAPFSNLPLIQAIPIVAMTASAIQGDKEKCQEAGMDDYLAKPVKGKTLEKMLVKWALRKKNSPHEARAGSFATDHNQPRANPRLGTSPASKHVPSSEKNRQAKYDAATSALPGAESEGDRGMARVVAEEKAVSLRDNKLIAAGENDSQSASLSMNGAPVRTDQPTTALTEENIGKLANEQDGGRFHPTTHKSTPSTQSLMVEGDGTNSPTSTWGHLRSSSRSFLGQSLNRNDSDSSQRTLTQK